MQGDNNSKQILLVPSLKKIKNLLVPLINYVRETVIEEKHRFQCIR